MLGIFSIIKFELSRFKRTLLQSLVVPIITTFLYLLVFGQAIGRSVSDYEINYALFIVPGVILLSVFNESLNNSSFGIYLPRFTGTIFEVLSSPLSSSQILIGYVFAATLKSILIGLLILISAKLLLDFQIYKTFIFFLSLIVIALIFCLIGFVIGMYSKSFDNLQFFPNLVITPLTFLGGAFYSISKLPEFFQNLSLLNPLFYFIDFFRWTIFGINEVSIIKSLFVMLLILVISFFFTLVAIKKGALKIN